MSPRWTRIWLPPAPERCADTRQPIGGRGLTWKLSRPCAAVALAFCLGLASAAGAQVSPGPAAATTSAPAPKPAFTFLPRGLRLGLDHGLDHGADPVPGGGPEGWVLLGGFLGGVFPVGGFLASVFDLDADGRIRIAGDEQSRLQAAQVLVDADF